MTNWTKKNIPNRNFLLLGLAIILTVAAVQVAINLAYKKMSILDTASPLYSQFNEEIIIRDFFHDRKHGLFVDVGAAWCCGSSTTYYLEKHLGWKGIAIDALPEYGADYAKYRPKTLFLSYLITDHFGTKEPFYRMAQSTGMSTAIKEVADTTGLGDQKGKYVVEMRPTMTLNKIMEKYKIKKIDFLSMDIEEAEPAALAGFDIKAYLPELVCVEAHQPIRAKLLEYFTKNDYVRIDKYLDHDTKNWYFRPANFN